MAAAAGSGLFGMEARPDVEGVAVVEAEAAMFMAAAAVRSEWGGGGAPTSVLGAGGGTASLLGAVGDDLVCCRCACV